SFRDGVTLDRYGVTPTVTIAPDARTKVTLRFEHLHDGRVADRGIPSVSGRPADVDVAAYFGNPAESRVRSRVNIAAAAVERQIGRQFTDNFRQTGFFGPAATSIRVTYDSPKVALPVTFHQSGTDADNQVQTHVGALYAQDQVDVSRYLQLVGGLRFDSFDLQY